MKSNSRILFISHNFPPFVGGTEVIGNLLANSFAEEGYDVHVVTWTKEIVPNNFPFLVIRNPNIFRLIREHMNANLLFENNPTLRLSWPAIFFRKPHIVVLHSWLLSVTGKIGFQEHLKRRWLKKSNKVIAISKALREKCWPESILIPNPYRSDQFKRISHIKKTRDFVFLGRLVEGKGVHLAIRAIAKLNSIGVKTNLTVVGTGPASDSLMELAKSYNLQHQIQFIGMLEGLDLVTSLNSHRFMVIPSISEETFGMVALEALACGCIPIGSDSGGLPEAIGQAGLLFKKNDIDELANCMHKIVSNKELETKLRARGPSHIKPYFKSNVIKKHLEIIETFI